MNVSTGFCFVRVRPTFSMMVSLSSCSLACSSPLNSAISCRNVLFFNSFDNRAIFSRSILFSMFCRCTVSANDRTLGVTVGRSSYLVVSELPYTCTVSALMASSVSYIV